MRHAHSHTHTNSTAVEMVFEVKIQDGKRLKVKGSFLCLCLLGTTHVKIAGPSHRHSVGSVNRIHGYCDGTKTVVCSDQAHEEPRL